ncbi:tRNA (adenosine(37)-N6)-threonylcarbamoyltransferase complex ATPase subunit type 1 TsaE [candidate division TA06 bacterium]|uniref:tRNA threonylcarbamoyladenosine biosynthesis protein TsaE n=1 Tax=candidate division TA06 bacterium TaxID=2250710 RepID=A0A933I9D6_UNCT6|nr:tRNA (adenosine(37)-N6)-threonylcarbamoyltransferase complex ATPase subunit type 1 TsaE [candidate division TA06 bacterium]
MKNKLTLSNITTTNSAEQTQTFGQSLAVRLLPGDVVCLWGDLGAGKTTLAQGICQGLQSKEIAVSPSYGLIHEYRGIYDIYHLDLYRLGNSAQAEEIGITDYLYGQGISIIEWPERIRDILPSQRLDIFLTRLDQQTRKIELKASGKNWNDRFNN